MPISNEMKTALANGTFWAVTLVRVTAKPSQGGDVQAFALHTRDLVYDGDTFKAMPFEPSQLAQEAGTTTDNATIKHLLGELITKANIKGRKWNGARLELMCVNLMDLTMGPARQHFGRIGDITTLGKQATTEFRGLMHLLNQEIGDRTSRRCRYILGDPDTCKKDLTSFRFTGTVTTVHNNQRITISTSKSDQYFKYGKIEFTSGLNDGLEMETIDNTGQMVTLFMPMPSQIQVGDSYIIEAGDDKSLATCHTKFNNAINHGGEDCMPAKETVFKFPEG